jgi:chorismate dehydratase
MQEIDLYLDVPSVCARKLIHNEVTIGLVPIAVLSELKSYTILTDYCIGAAGPVKSVVLFSDVPLSEITSISLDYQSRTSIMLTKVLAKNFWKIKPVWLETEKGYETKALKTNAVVVIGDRALQMEGRYNYVYDLAQEWYLYSKLPFVFACWVSNKTLSPDFISRFSEAIRFGVEHKKEAVASIKDGTMSLELMEDYVEKYISYDLDDKKKKGMALFLSLLKEL